MIEEITLTRIDGRQVKGRKITVCSAFVAEIDTVWQMIQKFDTLREICAPLARFVPCGEISPVWKQCHTMKFRLWLYGIIPVGVHIIHIERLDAVSHEIQSRESNRFVPVWDHFIKMGKGENCTTNYVDVVDIYAGCLTPFVAWWSERFYRHRQRRWHNIVRV
jgi:hypothetical protein